MFTSLFDRGATIWTCQCCSFRSWIDCKITDGEFYRCPNCNHAAPLVHPRKRDYEAEAKLLEKLDKKPDGWYKRQEEAPK